MKSYAFYNGCYGEYTSITVPLSDRAVFFGDGVYDVMIGRNRQIYQFDKHITRLLGNARHIALNADVSDTDILTFCKKLIGLASPEDGFMLYIQLSRNGERREHVFGKEAGYNLLITITDFDYSVNPKPISLITREDIRYRMCNIKTINLLPAVLASSAAARVGADECIFVRDGIVTECSHSNIHILRGDRLITHPTDRDILPGITRGNLIDLCKECGISVSESRFTVGDMMAADEVLITSTTKFLRRCSNIDGIDCGMRCSDTAVTLADSLVVDFLDSAK